jgi:hypothetical protein
MNLKVLLLIFALGIFSAISRADELAQLPIVFSGSLNTTSDPYFTLSLFVETVGSSPDPRYAYTFTDLTASEDGETFTINAGDDPGLFSSIASGNPLDVVGVSVTSPEG